MSCTRQLRSDLQDSRNGSSTSSPVHTLLVREGAHAVHAINWRIFCGLAALRALLYSLTLMHREDGFGYWYAPFAGVR
jgi:hypothetical protein